MPSVFKSNEQEILNLAQIANRFCENFTNIGPNLAKSILASVKSHRFFLKGGFVNSFFLQSASELEVTESCSSVQSSTAPGYDSVSMNFLKSHFLRKSRIARHSSKNRIFFYFAKTSLLVTQFKEK